LERRAIHSAGAQSEHAKLAALPEFISMVSRGAWHQIVQQHQPLRRKSQRGTGRHTPPELADEPTVGLRFDGHCKPGAISRTSH
jgi:hypothetical protein